MENQPEEGNLVQGKQIKVREINRVQLKDGDLLVVKFPQQLPHEAFRAIEATVETCILTPMGLSGKVKVIILDNGADIEVLSKVVPGGKWKTEG